MSTLTDQLDLGSEIVLKAFLVVAGIALVLLLAPLWIPFWVVGWVASRFFGMEAVGGSLLSPRGKQS